MIFTISNQKPTVDAIAINKSDIVIVQEFKYLGTILTHKLDFNKNCMARVATSRQRLHLSRKLSYVRVDDTCRLILTTYSVFISNSGFVPSRYLF